MASDPRSFQRSPNAQTLATRQRANFRLARHSRRCGVGRTPARQLGSAARPGHPLGLLRPHLEPRTSYCSLRVASLRPGLGGRYVDPLVAPMAWGRSGSRTLGDAAPRQVSETPAPGQVRRSRNAPHCDVSKHLTHGQEEAARAPRQRLVPQMRQIRRIPTPTMHSTTRRTSSCSATSPLATWRREPSGSRRRTQRSGDEGCPPQAGCQNSSRMTRERTVPVALSPWRKGSCQQNQETTGSRCSGMPLAAGRAKTPCCARWAAA